MNGRKSNIVIVSFVMLLFVIPQVSAESSFSPADVNVYVLGDIPTVDIDNWTAVNFRLIDRWGLNWTYFKTKFGFELDLSENKTIRDRFHNFIQYLHRRFTYRLWSVMFKFEIQRVLGYTSFLLTPMVIGENIKGWQVKIEPSILLESATGFKHNFTLYVKVDDSVMDYSVTVAINITRLDTLGDPWGYSWIYLPLKVIPQSYLSVSRLEQIIETTPKSITAVSFYLTNEGYYRNVFYLKTNTSTESLYSSVHQQATVIEPGETKKVTLSLITPEKVIDFGTPYIIDVYAAHSLNSSFIHIGSLTVITKGFYFSIRTILWICFTILIVLLASSIIVWYYNRWRRIFFGLPEKPWKIAEEKQLLRQLRKRDKKHYRKIKSMMKQEYQSALDWYQSFRTYQKLLE